MWTKAFWKDAAERALKTAGQFGLVGLGGNLTSVVNLDWQQVGGAMAAGALVSVLTSLASSQIGDNTPSLVATAAPAAPAPAAPAPVVVADPSPAPLTVTPAPTPHPDGYVGGV